ncbi:MAG: hypothetical protein K6U80_06720 [Firmicutes bacterium]|nr:hypothetical protein [Bacillota bacterium]
MGPKLGENRRNRSWVRDVARIWGTVIRGMGEIVKGLWAAAKWVVFAARPLWSGLRLIGRLGAGIVCLGRGIKKGLRVQEAARG